MGSRLRQLRRERDLSQASLAATLGLSASYVNQIEHDVRPLTVPVLLRITEVFGVDATFFSRDDDSRLLAEIQDVIQDKELCPSPVELQELSELVYNHPTVARTLVDVHRRYRNVRDKLSLATDARRTTEATQALSMPHDEVRDFFYARQNYVDDLDHHAEQLESSKTADGGFVYAHGDIVGQTGVEYQYESALQGVRGEQTVYVDAAGNVLSHSTSIAPQGGSDVVLTIDANIQKAAEASLVSVINTVRSQDFQGRSASVVALDCTNGEVIAMASYPTYSPSMFVGGISSSDWDTLSSEEANYPLMNRAIAGQYPSGSTIKALTTFAGLKYGICDGNSSWYCTGFWTGFGEQYGMHCWLLSGHGTVNLITGITNSCDIVLMKIIKI